MKRIAIIIAVSTLCASTASGAAFKSKSNELIRLPQRHCVASPVVPPSIPIQQRLLQSCDLAFDYAITEVVGGWARKATPLRCVYQTPRRDRCWVSEWYGWTSDGRLDKHNDLTIVWTRHWIDWVDVLRQGRRAWWSFK